MSDSHFEIKNTTQKSESFHFHSITSFVYVKKIFETGILTMLK